MPWRAARIFSLRCNSSETCRNWIILDMLSAYSHVPNMSICLEIRSSWKYLSHLDTRHRSVRQPHYSQRGIAGHVAVNLQQVTFVKHADAGGRRAQLQHILA